MIEMITIPIQTAPHHDELNAITVNVEQLSAARHALAQLAEHLRWDHHARHNALCADMPCREIVARTIDARLTALRKWEDIRDPDRAFDQHHLMAAAALAPLVDTDHGLGFDDATFGDLARFVGEVTGRASER
ncbi:MAG: hypothetical protein J0I47_10625 [Sphingomonas sp.]|uniref:hypothetical protein n=1 Tax=Sphingomonas sp. TaxID=28214 RepID=UPI001ACAA5DF|nr:hypothetical protein [Sphingomonas sp.]MBN8808668.1 hypothetical protein [Sphingomonas sp.]